MYDLRVRSAAIRVDHVSTSLQLVTKITFFEMRVNGFLVLVTQELSSSGAPEAAPSFCLSTKRSKKAKSRLLGTLADVG